MNDVCGTCDKPGVHELGVCIVNLRAERDRLREAMAKMPTLDEARYAVDKIRESVQSHRVWAQYRRKGGVEEDYNGDLLHHEKCVDEYARVEVILVKLAVALKGIAK